MITINLHRFYADKVWDVPLMPAWMDTISLCAKQFSDVGATGEIDIIIHYEPNTKLTPQHDPMGLFSQGNRDTSVVHNGFGICSPRIDVWVAGYSWFANADTIAHEFGHIFKLLIDRNAIDSEEYAIAFARIKMAQLQLKLAADEGLISDEDFSVHHPVFDYGSTVYGSQPDAV